MAPAIVFDSYFWGVAYAPPNSEGRISLYDFLVFGWECIMGNCDNNIHGSVTRLIASVSFLEIVSTDSCDWLALFMAPPLPEPLPSEACIFSYVRHCVLLLCRCVCFCPHHTFSMSLFVLSCGIRVSVFCLHR